MIVSPQPDYGLNPIASSPWTAAPSRPAASGAGPDEVTLTVQGQELQRLTEVIAGLPEPVSPRAAEVMARIREGTYHVPGDAVAEHLIQRLQERQRA